MSAEPSVAIEALLRIAAAAKACGVPAELSTPQTTDGLLRVPGQAWVGFWARLDGTAKVAIRLAEQAAAGKALTFEYIARNSETVGDALGTLGHYGRLEQNVCHRDSYLSTEGHASLSHVCGFPGECTDRSHVIFYFAEVTLLVRSLAGAERAPVVVRLKDSDPSNKELLEAFFRCPVVLRSSVDEITFSKDLAAKPITNPDRKLRTIVARMADDAARSLGNGSSIMLRSEAALARGLLTQSPSLRSLAKTLALSTRTLQRRLAEEGTSAEAIIDQMRHKHAVAQLRAGAKNMRRLAAELGYASANSFYRAFQRWEGCSPTQFKLRQPQASRGLDATQH
jgi:AraC-like DNA-binding protein